MLKTLSSLNVVHVGKFHYGSTAVGRASGIRAFAGNLTTFNLSDYFPFGLRGKYSVQRLFGDGPDVRRLNFDLLECVRARNPDIILIEKGLLIFPSSIDEMHLLNTRPLIAHFSPDDQMNPDNRSRHYQAAMKLYDAHVTTKSFNVNELKLQGAREVIFQRNGFDPELHRPIEVSALQRKSFGAQASFVGAYELERGLSLKYLDTKECPVRIWGPGWQSAPVKFTHSVHSEDQAVWGEDYVAVVNCTAINLCFLRKVNRDLTTSRTVEIPACGGFMLAERTDEHQAIFEEGKQAEFFASDAELYDKIQYYSKNDKLRADIAHNGWRRVNSEFSYLTVMRDTFVRLLEMRYGN